MTDTPDAITPIAGWRAWRIDTDTPTPNLVSLMSPTIWPARQPLLATCNRGHKPPSAGCRCGIYAVASLDQLLQLGYGHPPRSTEQDPIAVGQVWLWGTVVIATRGYRGERGYPKKFTLLHEHWREARALARHYGIPVSIRNLYRLGDTTWT
jgi:hypothetical protein